MTAEERAWLRASTSTWISRSWYDRGALIVNRRLAEDDQGARFDGSNYA